MQAIFTAGSTLFRQAQRNVQDFDYMVHAVGMGVRYKTPIGPVRVDLVTVSTLPVTSALKAAYRTYSPVTPTCRHPNFPQPAGGRAAERQPLPILLFDRADFLMSLLLLFTLMAGTAVIVDRVAVVVESRVIKTSDVERDTRITEFLKSSSR